MWSRAVQIALHPHIQRRRIRGYSTGILIVRLLEGAACWGIVYGAFSGVTVPAWAVHLDFVVYGVANLLLFVPQRGERMTPALVWVDILVNLATMGVAAHWSGGIYSPLLPVFVIKIGSYGLIYGVDVGLHSLVATGGAAVVLALVERAGLAPSEQLEQVPPLVRQRLSLAMAALIFAIGVEGFFRFFRVLQDRETRLAQAMEEKDRLYQESLAHQHDLRQLSRKVMEVSEATMRHLARELHDDLGQALTAVRMELGLLDFELPAESAARQRIREARAQIGAILQGVRNLSQLLRPAVLDDLGLIPAMQSYIAGFGERTGVLVHLTVPPPETRLSRSLEVALYRIMQEALTNVARHARARRVDVQLHVAGDALTLCIADDGCGFDATALRSPPPGHGMGLIGMRERVAVYGGELVIASHIGSGTRVELSISRLDGSADGSQDDDGEDTRLVG